MACRYPIMKALRKFLLPVWLLFLVLPAESRAGYVDDLKVDVARLLPPGTHQDKVRQFLRVRKFKVTEQPKEKTISGRLVTRKMFTVESTVVVVFEFDDAGLIKDVRYSATKAGS
jgi:hypothetical protein